MSSAAKQEKILKDRINRRSRKQEQEQEREKEQTQE